MQRGLYGAKEGKVSVSMCVNRRVIRLLMNITIERIYLLQRIQDHLGLLKEVFENMIRLDSKCKYN